MYLVNGKAGFHYRLNRFNSSLSHALLVKISWPPGNKLTETKEKNEQLLHV